MTNDQTLVPNRWLACGLAMVAVLVAAPLFGLASEVSTRGDEPPQAAEAVDTGCGQYTAVTLVDPLGLELETPPWTPVATIERGDCSYRCVNSGGEEAGFFACPTGWSLERCCAKLRQVCADQGGLSWAICQGIDNFRICFTTWPPWED